jgi:hypothetical protein
MMCCARRANIVLMKLAHTIVFAGVLLAVTNAHADPQPEFKVVAGARGETPNNDTQALGGVGAGVLVASWLASVGTVVGTTTCSGGLLGAGGIQCHSFSGWALLPVIGPTIALGDNTTKKTMNGEIAFYGAMTAVNVLALAAIIVGYTSRPSPSKHIRFMPMSASTMGLGGTF